MDAKRVLVFGDESGLTKSVVVRLKASGYKTILYREGATFPKDISFVVFIALSLARSETDESFVRYINTFSSVSLYVVTPVYSDLQPEIFKRSLKTRYRKVFYVGDLLGFRGKYPTPLRMFIKDISYKKTVYYSPNIVLYPVLKNDFLNFFISAIEDNGSVYFLADEWVMSDLVNYLEGLLAFKSYKFKVAKSGQSFSVDVGQVNKLDLDYSSLKIFESRNSHFSFGLVAALGAFWLFLLPIILMLLSLFLAFLALVGVRSGGYSMRLARVSGETARTTSRVVGFNEGFGFGYVGYPSLVVKSLNFGRINMDLFEEVLPIFLNKGNGVFVAHEVVGELFDKLSYFSRYYYREASYFSSALNYEKLNIELNKYSNILYFAPNILTKFEEILGFNGERSYLFLFQNTMELRPTGGFIGSVAVVTLERGQISYFKIYDVYSVDGQLEGYVAPPAAISKYLGEAKWYLRDSNWDPDFRVSAKRAAWFFEKSMDMKVNGVVAVNLDLLGSFIDKFGPVEVSDYGDYLDSSNYKEKIHSEVEDGFFAGSTKKADYLSSIYSGLILKVSNFGFVDYIKFLDVLYGGLISKDIQLAVFEDDVSSYLTELNFDGSIVKPLVCEVCVNEVISVVESNVGVNKVNVFVERNAQINIEVNDKSVYFEVKHFVFNKSDKERYKNYLRLIKYSPSLFNNSNLLEVEGYGDGMLSGGSINSILPGGSLESVFSWSQERKGGDLNLYIEKQSGVGAYPIKLVINNASSDNLVLPDGFSLTQDGSYEYNSTLSRDINFFFDFISNK